jgi:hypothetical protein
MENYTMSEFGPMILVLIILIVALIGVIMVLTDREMDREFPPISRKREKARMMSEEYRK